MDEVDDYLDAVWPELYRLAYLISGNRASADDLVQETSYKMVRSWRRLRDVENRWGYVRRIMVNAVIDQKRAASSHDLSDVRWQLVDEPVRDIGPSVVASTDLWRLVTALPPRQRAIIVLRYYEDLSEKEIVSTLGCRPGTVKSQAAPALRTLAGRFHAEDQGAPKK